jgi:hypothetical protein
VSPTNISVVFTEGIVGSLVSTRIAGLLVSTSGALIRRASIIGASIIGASRVSIANSNIAIKRSYSTSSLDSEWYSSFSYFLSSFRWCYPS